MVANPFSTLTTFFYQIGWIHQLFCLSSLLAIAFCLLGVYSMSPKAFLLPFEGFLLLGI